MFQAKFQILLGKKWWIFDEKWIFLTFCSEHAYFGRPKFGISLVTSIKGVLGFWGLPWVTLSEIFSTNLISFLMGWSESAPPRGKNWRKNKIAIQGNPSVWASSMRCPEHKRSKPRNRLWKKSVVGVTCGTRLAFWKGSVFGPQNQWKQKFRDKEGFLCPDRPKDPGVY